MIYFTSDTHFGHGNVLKFTKRPYKDIARMNVALINNINARVGRDDELYILGDFSFKIPAVEATALRKKINCRRVYLVPGNHDKGWGSGPRELEGVFEVLPPIHRLKINGRKYVLSHYPLVDWPSMSHGSFMLHGHIHSQGSDYNELNRMQGIYRYDVGMDANGLRPVSLEEIDAWFAGVSCAGRARWRSWVAPEPGPAREIAQALLADEYAAEQAEEEEHERMVAERRAVRIREREAAFGEAVTAGVAGTVATADVEADDAHGGSCIGTEAIDAGGGVIDVTGNAKPAANVLVGASDEGMAPSASDDLAPKIFAKTIDPEAVEQVRTLAELPPFKDSHIRVMPDAHKGKGGVIGFTARLGDKVVPNVVGVDVGCGVLGCRLDEEFSTDLLKRLDKAAHKVIPVGTRVHDTPQIEMAELEEYRCFRGFHDHSQLLGSLGTLGGGNHFIELDLTDGAPPWLVVHTGSRGIGAQLARYWQGVAVQQRRGTTFRQTNDIVETLKAQGRQREIEPILRKIRAEKKAAVPEDLCWLEGPEKDDYLHDMRLAQQFASRNRRRIVELLCEEAGVRVSDGFIESVHNYIDLDARIIRKGAISAQYDEPVIIPLNMAAGCVIGLGEGEEDWNCSAPHGAGRAMSRKKAFRDLTMEEYRERMKGIYSTTVCEQTLDEAPMAYKDPAEIIAELGPTVSAEFFMRPAWNFKATE